jgi:hypothetical protein
MKKNLLTSFGVVLVLAIIPILVVKIMSANSALWLGSGIQTQKPAPTTQTQMPPQIQNISSENSNDPVEVPLGWENYSNEKWNFALAYPSNWTLAEVSSPNGKLGGIDIKGEGYDVLISKGAGDLREANWTHPVYTIGGMTTKTWQTEVNGGYELVVAVSNSSFQFYIHTPDKTKKLSDLLLTTVKFY